jgi:hypothetical protein
MKPPCLLTTNPPLSNHSARPLCLIHAKQVTRANSYPSLEIGHLLGTPAGISWSKTPLKRRISSDETTLTIANQPSPTCHNTFPLGLNDAIEVPKPLPCLPRSITCFRGDVNGIWGSMAAHNDPQTHPDDGSSEPPRTSPQPQ